MDFYHGSIVGGLTELVPFAKPGSNLNESAVYLTTSKQLALHYILDGEGRPPRTPMLKIREDGVLVFQEMFSGALEYLYKGLRGYIYHCVGDYELNEQVKVITCATSSVPVPIKDYDYIEDVYERITEYKKYGMFVYEKYEELPQWRHNLIRGFAMIWIKDALTTPNHPEFGLLQRRYPQYWKEAEVLYKNGLL